MRRIHNTQHPIRRKLWQIEANFHCSIVGTCLDDRALAKAEREHREHENADVVARLARELATANRALGKAELVFCPVDCVSHSACLRAKRFCQARSRRFVPLRTAGVSSFVRGLDALASS